MYIHHNMLIIATGHSHVNIDPYTTPPGTPSDDEQSPLPPMTMSPRPRRPKCLRTAVFWELTDCRHYPPSPGTGLTLISPVPYPYKPSPLPASFYGDDDNEDIEDNDQIMTFDGTTSPRDPMIIDTNTLAHISADMKEALRESRNENGYPITSSPSTRKLLLLAPLQQSLGKTGKAHPNLREIAFSEDNSLACRIFDFAGSLKSYELINEEQLDLVMRDFLHQDPEGAGMICAIEDTERWVDGFERYLRREKKKEQREANKAKGPERWNSVLRGRKDNEANKDEGPERWNGALRGRAIRGRK